MANDPSITRRVKARLALLLSFACLGIPAEAGVVINEFCNHPHPTNDTGLEWIELYNPDTTAHNIAGWDLYPSRSPHLVFPEGTVIGPGAFLLVRLRLEGLNTGIELFEGTEGISSNMPNTRGSLALFTSANRDTIVDFVQYGDDSMTYEAMAAGAGIWTRGFFLDTARCGNSLALAIDGLDSNRPADWQELLQPTPGYGNQPSPVEVGVSGLAVDPALPSQPFALRVEVSSLGTDTARQVRVEIFEDQNGDSLPSIGEARYALLDWNALAGIRTASIIVPGQPEGQYNFAVAVSCSGDVYPGNNCRQLTTNIGSPVVLNEIMFWPHSGLAEWVELFNRSGRPADIRGWSIEDANAKPSLITAYSQTMAPGAYLILTSIENQPLAECPRLKPIGGWPTLNDYGDLVRLRDQRGMTEDLVQYLPEWGRTQGASLERINPCLISNTQSSWGLSLDPAGSTPGRRNSIFSENPGGEARLSAGPNPFSPDGDGREEHTVINYRLPWERGVVSISVLDRLGRRIRSLMNSRSSPREGCQAWDGRDDQGRKCPVGLYIILLEAGEEGGGGTIRAKAVVALAGRL